MYERFYDLQERAFELTSDPRFLLLTPGHREALSNVEYGIAFRRGFTLLLGEAGTGKTTILRRALSVATDTRGATLVPIVITNPTLTRAEFLEALTRQFGFGPDATSKSRFLQDLEAALRERRASGWSSVLVIDEAQALPYELLEELRLLGNIESDTEKLLPIVLAAQPEFAARLNEPRLRQLKQRVGLRCTLAALSLPETAAYIAGRIRIAGGNPGLIFSRDAVIAIYRYSRGIPRTISVICDNALVNGLAAARRPIDADLIEEVCGDFDLQPLAPAVVPRPTDAPEEPRPSPDNVRPFLSHSLMSTARASWLPRAPWLTARLGESR